MSESPPTPAGLDDGATRLDVFDDPFRSAAGEIVGFVQKIVHDAEILSETDKSAALYQLQGQITALLRTGDHYQWAAYLTMDEIRTKGFYKVDYPTFEEWLDNQRSDLKVSRRTALERLASVRVALHGLGRSAEDLVNTSPTTMTHLLRNLDYDPRTGEIKDDGDPLLKNGKLGRQAAQDAFENVKAMLPGDARAELDEVTGKSRPRYSVNLADVHFERRQIDVQRLAVYDSEGTFWPIIDTDDDNVVTLSFDLARDLFKRLGLDFNSVVLTEVSFGMER